MSGKQIVEPCTKRIRIGASEALKAACIKYHPQHVQALHKEVATFTALVQKKSNFEENNVYAFGDVDVEPNCLLSNMAFIEEGLPYTVDGTTKIFDSAQHLYEFLCHGIPDQVDKWARGGVLSCYIHVFGEERGKQMKESKWKNFIGVIPYVLMKPNQKATRASLGLDLRDDNRAGNMATGTTEAQQTVKSLDHYLKWRPVLMAKFNIPRFKELLVSTKDMYLLDSEDPKSMTPDSKGGCILYPKPKKSKKDPQRNQARAEYEKAKKEGRRVDGKLHGKNRIGRFLMAIRSELFMIAIVNSNSSKTSVCPSVATEGAATEGATTEGATTEAATVCEPVQATTQATTQACGSKKRKASSSASVEIF